MRHVELRPGLYRDSVRLMQISTALSRRTGISAALVAMATPVNLELLVGMGFDPPTGSPNDLLVALAGDDDGLASALTLLESELDSSGPAGSTGTGEAVVPRTTATAVRGRTGPVVLVSTPGEHAFVEAMDALNAGAAVMVFSDNMPVEQEVVLKQTAGERGLLVLGPDCGTAVIGGVGLGFANVVRPGPLGLVAASGTGAQQVMSLLGRAGVGISHCLGVGGRDLSTVVGGRSTHTALDLLDADPDTDLIVLIGKPAAAEVAEAVDQHARSLGTPVLVAPLGAGRPDLTAVTETILRRLGTAVPDWPTWEPEHRLTAAHGHIRGLFSGGTLCVEAMVIVSEALGPVWSNVPVRPEWTLDRAWADGADGHVMLDLGADEYTLGRPHPMLDFGPRLAKIAEAAADPGCGVLLLDVVLGHGAHPDPAAELAPAIRRALAARPDLTVLVSLIGTPEDPQDLPRQAQALCAAGARIFASNAAAARVAVHLLSPATAAPDQPANVPPTANSPESSDSSESSANPAGPGSSESSPSSDSSHSSDSSDSSGYSEVEGGAAPSWLVTGPGVVAVGARALADALADQAADHVTVDWRPPPPGTAAGLARVFADPRRATANAAAVTRMLAAGASLVDVRPAAEVIGLQRGQFCHAGPPIDWDRASGPMRGALMAALLLENLATDPADAERQLAAGRLTDGTPITLTPCHDRGGVGPMAGVVSPSMWVWVLRDDVHGSTSWCTLNEGLGKVLRYGAYGPEVIDRLRWMGEVLGPALATAVRATGPLDVKAIIGQMVQMGDEGHNRNRAGTLMLLRDLLPSLVESAVLPAAEVARVARFIGGNDHFFLNLVMPAAKLQSLAAAGIPGSTVVTVLARNGTDFGVQVAGTGGRWFTGPAGEVTGMYLGGYGPADANPDIGDSAITETVGLGGFAMASAPAIVRFVGGSVADAMRTTREMYEITIAENPAYALPVLDFRGTPTGIDVTAVVRTGILPQINTGIAGRLAGTGQVGAGLVTPPLSCFTAALGALAAAT